MTLLDSALPSLAELLGLDPGPLAGQSHMAVEIDRVGQIHAEHHGERVLLYLSRPIEAGADRLSLYRDALRAVHPDNALPRQVQCALSGETLVLVAQHGTGETDSQDLEASLDLLIALHDGLSR
ncbi:MAG: CesT family type III secretion system chaperone [Pseudomonadota bacterium]